MSVSAVCHACTQGAACGRCECQAGTATSHTTPHLEPHLVVLQSLLQLRRLPPPLLQVALRHQHLLGPGERLTVRPHRLHVAHLVNRQAPVLARREQHRAVLAANMGTRMRSLRRSLVSVTKVRQRGCHNETLSASLCTQLFLPQSQPCDAPVVRLGLRLLVLPRQWVLVGAEETRLGRGEERPGAVGENHLRQHLREGNVTGGLIYSPGAEQARATTITRNIASHPCHMRCAWHVCSLASPLLTSLVKAPLSSTSLSNLSDPTA